MPSGYPEKPEILLQLAEQVRPFVPVFTISDGCIFLPGYEGRCMMKNGDPAACMGPFHLFLFPPSPAFCREGAWPNKPKPGPSVWTGASLKSLYAVWFPVS